MKDQKLLRLEKRKKGKSREKGGPDKRPLGGLVISGLIQRRQEKKRKGQQGERGVLMGDATGGNWEKKKVSLKS